MKTHRTFSLLTASLFTLAAVTASYAAATSTDNFNDGNFTANPSWTPTNGTWTVSSGVLNQTATFGNHIFGPHRLLVLDGVTDNGPYIASADMGINDSAGNNSVGIAFHVQDTDNFYAFVFFPGYPGGALRFLEVTGGTAVTNSGADINMVTPPIAPSLSVFHHMQVVVDGPNFTVTVSGPTNSGPYSYTQNFTDSSFSGGGVALYSQISPGFFDNFVLVPEPASMAIALPALALLIKRRRA